VILSNCVINLVPDKAQVYREAFRALKPGGRLAISDVVNKAPLPAKLKDDPSLLCGCVGGAATVQETEDWLTEAGFVDIRVTPKAESRELMAPGRRAAASRNSSSRPSSRAASPLFEPILTRAPDQRRGIRDVRRECGSAPRGTGNGHLRALPDGLGCTLYCRGDLARAHRP
jgi:SAM-dependent methyltransferase